MGGVISAILIVVIGILMPGIINRTRAKLSGRKGIRMFQHLFDVRVMLRKSMVEGEATSMVSRVAPSVYLGAIFTAMLFIPVAGFEPLFSFRGDVVMFAYLLGLSRLAMVLAALDTGSSFQGMGASRDVLYGAFIEPAIFIAAGTLALVSGMTGFSEIFTELRLSTPSPENIIVMLLLVVVVVGVILVESGRIPIDDPRTHLELTMIHEVVVLDFTGVDLAMITVAGWLKMAILSVLAVNIITSLAGNGWVVTLVLISILAIVIGSMESFRGRNKMSKNTTFILTIVAIAFLLFMVAFLLSLDIAIG